MAEWTDTQALRALIQHGQDTAGNLLLGDLARERFLNTPLPEAVPAGAKGEVYVRLAREAASGDLPGSSAGGALARG